MVNLTARHVNGIWKTRIPHYGRNTEISEYLTCIIFGLPFLDPQSVGDCFSFESAEIQSNNEKKLENV